MQKNFRWFALLFLIFITEISYSQWRATLTFNPRPTPYIDEWRSNPSIGSLTLFNPSSSPADVVIYFEVTNMSANKVILRGHTSPQHVNPSPSPTFFTNNNFIGSSGLQYDEAQKVTMVRTGMLPEGEYSICVKIENAAHQVVAENVCSNFSIQFVNPPQLISPSHERTLDDAPQSFQWTTITPPSGGMTSYQLQVAEVVKGQSPTDALRGVTPLINRGAINGPTFLMPQEIAKNMKTGATYAWRIKAVDASGKPFARNEGTSEIFTFTVKSKVADIKPIAKKISIALQTTIKGIMKYAFADPFGKEGLQTYPLKNTKVRLVLRQFSGSGNTIKFIGDDSTIAKGATDGNGNFSVTTSFNDSIGLIAVMGKGKLNGGKGVGLYRGAFLIIDDVHYTSPSTEIAFESGKTIDAGELRGGVKSFGLAITVKDVKPPYVMGGATVYLLRWKSGDHVPEQEGSPRPNPPEDFFGTQILAKGTCDNFGRISFGRLVRCFYDEQYVIFVTPPADHSGYNYPFTKYPADPAPGVILFQLFSPPTLSSEYKWEEYKVDIAPDKIESQVKGKLVLGFEGSKDNKKPLANIDVKLQIRYKNNGILPAGFAPESYPENGKVVAYATTDAKGEFVFKFTDIPKSSNSSAAERVYRIIQGDVRYSSPDDDVTLEPGEIKKVGTLTANLRTFNLTVHAQTHDTKESLPGTYIYARIAEDSKAFPEDEGAPHPNPEMTISYERVIAIGLTDDGGNTTLTNIGRGYSLHYFHARSDPATGKNFVGNFWEDFSYDQNPTEFNSQYIVPTFTKSVNMIPLPPTITGRVLRDDNHMVGVADALVLMTSTPEPDWHPGDVTTTTDKDGYYYIDGNKNNDFARHISASKIGYGKSAIKDIPVSLKKGEQSYNDLFIMPKAIVTGKVYHQWTSAHTGLQGAWVTVENGSSVYTYSEFSLPTNLEEPGKVFFEPDDHSYFNDTAYTYQPHGTLADLGKIYLQKKLHRIKIVTIDEETNQVINSNIVATEMANPQFPGSVIPPSNWGADTSKWTPFESSDKYFTFTTYTNTSVDYEHRTYSIKNPLSKDFILYKITTRKAGFISGTVYLYSKKSGKKDKIDYAKIRMVQNTNNSDGEIPFSFQPGLPGSQPNSSKSYTFAENYAYSGYSLDHLPGVYKLGNISIGKHTFKASKSKSGSIGEEKSLNVPKGGLKNVDFFLQVYEDMDITQMLGITMSVDKLDSLPGGVFISGSFSELPASPHFSADANVEVGFTKIRITPGTKKGATGVPYPKPFTLPLVTDVSTIPISYLYSSSGKYNAQLKAPSGNLKITSSTDEKGSLGGKIYMPVNQFSPKVSFLSGKENGFYLAAPNGSAPGNMDLPVIAADGKDAFALYPNGLQITDSKGGSGSFTLSTFNATFNSVGSLIRGDSVTLATTLNLPDISDAKKTIPLSIGIVRLRGKDVAISLPSNASLPEIALDNWKMKGDKLSFTGDNLSMDGTLKTGTVDVPFTGLPITPQGWKPEQAVFKLSSLSIASVIPLAIDAPVKFGHDVSAKPPSWKLYSNQAANTNAASFGGITGMPTTDSIYITSFTLSSFGSNVFTLKPNTPIHLFTYLTFTPISLSVSGPGTIAIKGDSYLGVADGFLASNKVLSVSLQNSALVFDPKKALSDIKDYYVKGTKVNLPVSGQELNGNGFFAKGTLVDQPHPDAYSFPVRLSCTSDSTAISILAQDANGTAPIFPISKDGSRKLVSIVGGTRYDNASHHWDNLRFSGDLAGATGAAGKMNFKVSGALQTDGDQAISVTNIPTPFGECSLTFNFATGSMHGAINLNADLPGAGHIDGQADLQIDKSGWYFAANGNLQIQNPNIGILVAMAFGSYPNVLSIKEITDKFDNIAWKPEVPVEMRTLPQAYNTLAGFYFCGECTNFLGITLPSVDVDLDPVVHCKISAYYGAALSLGMNFSVGTQFNIGAAAFVGVDADAGGSIGIACGGGKLHAGLNMYGVGSFNTSTGKWSVEGGSDLNLTGEMYAGWGICDDDCGYVTCDKHTWGPKTITYGLFGFKVGTDGFKISL